MAKELKEKVWIERSYEYYTLTDDDTTTVNYPNYLIDNIIIGITLRKGSHDDLYYKNACDAIVYHVGRCFIR